MKELFIHTGLAQFGRAPVSKTGCREFESLDPCEIKEKHEDY